MLSTQTPSSHSDSGDLMRYLSKVQSFPMLSQEDEESLTKNWYENASVNCAHKLVTSHLRLVVKIAMGFKNYGLPLMELILEGNVGLMYAIKKFDPTLGFRLSTYAVWWIKASIKDYILKSWSFVKIGTTQAQRKLFFSLRRIKKRIAKYTSSSSAISSEDAKTIADECSVSVQDVIDMNKRLLSRDQSLNEPIYSNGKYVKELQDTLACSIPNQEACYLVNEEISFKKEMVNDALSKLNTRYRDIFVSRRMLEEPETLEKLSIKYNISRERVRQIEMLAFNKIKDFIESHRHLFGY